MKIYYSPSYIGQNFIEINSNGLELNTQVLETQGLLNQLALHAGIHQEIPSYATRLADYHGALMTYDETYPDNIFHRSIEIDSMSVAKTLMGWRDALTLAGWNCGHVGASQRLDALAVIESNYEDAASDVATLLHRMEKKLQEMIDGKTAVPSVYKEMTICVPCENMLLPDYIQPLFDLLEQMVERVEYATLRIDDMPKKMEIVKFSQQYKAEAWLSQQKADDYDVWINADNKRLDNWLHMSGKPVAGSEMLQSNPQITQMFLLAIQLFQRPLNVNTLLQYLYLPECPLPWKLTSRLASMIVREGGFCNDKVIQVIKDYLARELKKEDDETKCELSAEERKELYHTYLPFDLLDDRDSKFLAEETDEVDVKKLKKFLKKLKGYAGNRAARISAVKPNDMRIAQLKQVAALIDALMALLPDALATISFRNLQQWAQSLYETCDFKQYNAQVGSLLVVNNPSNIVGKAKRAIWCDFYGDVSSALSTDFLSPNEIEILSSYTIKLWNREHEKAFRNLMMSAPLHQTTDKLTFVVCERLGMTELPIHPLRLQLPSDVEETDGDSLFAQLKSIDIKRVNNHRETDTKEVTFDAKEHPVEWRKQESFSALEKLLQNPLDYFMNYVLGFSDLGPTEIKMSLTSGNVAHEVIEALFTAERGDATLTKFVNQNYDAVFKEALIKRGALLLLPEHHLDNDRLRHQLKRCVNQLAEIIQTNGLKVIKCEQEEVQDLGFEDGVVIKGYIDMLLQDTTGKDVVFDLKWTNTKDKYKNLVKENRAAQLAIYQAMLQQHEDHPDAARTAYFVMPIGKLYSSDEFIGENFELVKPQSDDDIMDQLRKGYAERRNEIDSGRIETSDLLPISDIAYANAENVFPLETDGRRTNPNKAENKYSDYKCFTI